jgi:hypothetical protein
MGRAKVDRLVAKQLEPVSTPIGEVRTQAESRLGLERKRVDDVERQLQAELKRMTSGLAPGIKLPKIGI